MLGIINPTNGITPAIKLFVMTSPIHAYSYADNIASNLTPAVSPTLPAPAILFMQNLVISSSDTRVLTDYKFTLKI